MYHFFPAIPFVILATAYAARALVDRHPGFRHLVRAHGLVALGLFALFYPVLSGLAVPRSFVLHGLRWLPSWVLCQ
jgi:dolichyl-phosphate-mannose--protein O-mannosyl transferase